MNQEEYQLALQKPLSHVILAYVFWYPTVVVPELDLFCHFATSSPLPSLLSRH